MKKIYCCIIVLSVLTGAAAGYLNGVAAVSMIKRRAKIRSFISSRAKQAFKAMQKKVNF